MNVIYMKMAEATYVRFHLKKECQPNGPLYYMEYLLRNYLN